MIFDVRLSKYVQKAMKKAFKKRNDMKETTRLSLKQLESGPYVHSLRLVGSKKGMRRIHIGNTSWRMLYSICEECRENKEEKLNRCFNCAEMDLKTVIVRDFDLRKRIYKKKRTPQFRP